MQPIIKKFCQTSENIALFTLKCYTETLATVPLATVPQNFSFEKPPYRTFFRNRTTKKQV